MAAYFGAGLEGALQGYNQALSNQPAQVARILALKGEMQRQAILNKQLQDQQMAGQALLSYYGTPQTPAPSMPSVAPAPSPGQASVPSVVATGNMPSWAIPQPTASPVPQPVAPAQGVGPAGIMPYKSMSDIVQEVRQKMPGASPGAIMAAAGQIAKGEQLAMTAQERMLALQSLDAYRQALLAQRSGEQNRPFSDLGKLAADYKAGRITKQEYEAGVNKATHTPVTNVSVNGGSPMGSDPNFWFDYYYRTKQLPPMAWGQAGNPTRQQFLNDYPKWVAQYHPEDVGAGGTAASQATYKANTAALSRVTTDLNTFEPYQRMLDTNADIALKLGRKISLTNSALVNKSVNWLRQNATNNPDVAEYLAQIRFVQTEAARVINNPRIVGQLTDEGRREIEQVINGNAPIAVVDRVLKRLKIDGANRFNKMRDQQAQLQKNLSAKTTAGAIAAPAQGGSSPTPSLVVPSATSGSNVVDFGSLK